MIWITFFGFFYLASFSFLMIFLVGAARANEAADCITEEFIFRLRRGDFAEVRLVA
jgi:hypothetical protein